MATMRRLATWAVLRRGTARYRRAVTGWVQIFSIAGPQGWLAARRLRAAAANCRRFAAVPTGKLPTRGNALPDSWRENREIGMYMASRIGPAR